MQKLSRRLPMLVIGILGVAGLLWFSLQPERSSESAHQKNGIRSQLSTAERAQNARSVNFKIYDISASELPTPGPLPPYLQGAEPDVSLQQDEHGDLVLGSDLIALFDFFLGVLEEEPLETVLVRIHHALHSRLNGRALAQAKELLRRYVDYRIGLAELDEQSPRGTVANGLSAQALQERYQNLKTLRQSIFSNEENAAFFQLDDTQDEYMLQRLNVMEDASLSDTQRQQALAALEQQLPEEVRALRRRITQDAELYLRTEALQQSGATSDEIYRIRAETLGHEAAMNLARLDQSRAQWKQRLADYVRERADISQSGLSQADQQAAVESLLERRFNKRERLRIRALTAE